MNEQNKISQTDGSIQILTNLSLWNTLFGDTLITPKRKFTKGEAFYDLLQRQKRALKEDQEALPGNFQSLADAWGWHRQTVRRFFEELTAIGAVTIERQVNQTVIQIPHMTIDPGNALGPGHTITGDNISPIGNPP